MRTPTLTLALAEQCLKIISQLVNDAKFRHISSKKYCGESDWTDEATVSEQINTDTHTQNRKH